MDKKYKQQIEDARRFISAKVKGGRLAVVFHGDCDGVSAGCIAVSALERMGAAHVTPVWPDKGQSLYDIVLQQRLSQINPELCLVLDMGSRGQRPVPDGLPVVVIDHHPVREKPPVDVFVTGTELDPVPTASLITYEVFQDISKISDLDWLAALGLAADLTIDAPFDILKNARKKYGRKNILDTVSLINSAKRSSAHAISTAFEVIRAARVPADIASCMVPGCERLARFRTEVFNELRRVSVIPPVFAKPWAFIGFSSLTQIHGVVAMKWSRRLTAYRVIAANYGYTPGKVHFSVRTLRDENLAGVMQEVAGPEDEQQEIAYGHGSAIGGVLTFDEYGELMQRLGFPPEIHQRLKSSVL